MASEQQRLQQERCMKHQLMPQERLLSIVRTYQYVVFSPSRIGVKAEKFSLDLFDKEYFKTLNSQYVMRNYFIRLLVCTFVRSNTFTKMYSANS